VVEQGLQAPVADRGAAQAERVDVLGGEREGVDHVQGVLVGGADQAEGVESAPDERVVELAAIAARHLAQFAALQRGQQAAPVARTAVQCVPNYKIFKELMKFTHSTSAGTKLVQI